jgi:hypothetical protein
MLPSKMPLSNKRKKKMREYQKEWFKNNKNKSRLIHKRILERKKDYVRKWKEIHPCYLCGESDINVLVFHHLEPRNGEHMKTISYLTKYHGMKRLKEEIEKCAVVCRNCHIKIHYGDIENANE